MTKSSFSLESRVGLTLQNQCNSLLIELRKVGNVIISVYSEKTSDKIQHPLLIKILTKLEIAGILLNLIKSIYENTIPTSQSMTKELIFLC